ncbi:MAG: acyltransferase, partial [Clostridia bacterium]|nr:acyltransferase [Clostridia bacterium]
MNERDTSITKHIGVLDGIRAISVIIVMVFHFFQQTWIFPTVKTPRLSSFGIGAIDFTPLARTGYLMVDMMILISGFLLFLPVARNILFGEQLSKWRVYFKKRAVRILPSYLFCIIVLFIYELSMGSYGSPVNKAEAARDLIYHLLFMQNWRIDTYWFTKLNTVLWTVAVEVWFYILFPVIALIIKRTKKEKNAVFALIRAAVAAAAMIGISFVYIYGFVLRPESEFALKVNNTLQI